VLCLKSRGWIVGSKKALCMSEAETVPMDVDEEKHVKKDKVKDSSPKAKEVRDTQER